MSRNPINGGRAGESGGACELGGACESGGGRSLPLPARRKREGEAPSDLFRADNYDHLYRKGDALAQNKNAAFSNPGADGVFPSRRGEKGRGRLRPTYFVPTSMITFTAKAMLWLKTKMPLFLNRGRTEPSPPWDLVRKDRTAQGRAEFSSQTKRC